MDYLDQLENKSIYIIREAYYQYKKLAMLWSIGKDSTTMLWLARKAFFGTVPFPIIHIDTTYKFPEMYRFRDKYARDWQLNLMVTRNEEALKRGVGYETHDAFTCSHELKTVALQQTIVKENLKAMLVGIRRDEHGIRAKERYFSPRTIDFKWNYNDQPPELWNQYKSKLGKETHVRVHPLLHWTEIDIWRYAKRENIPVNKLYFAKDGQRYRSLGCKPITKPIKSNADTVDKIISELETIKDPERAGRLQDKEQANTMEKLRSLGYM